MPRRLSLCRNAFGNVVIGGGAAAGWDLFAPPLLVEIQKRAYREPAARVKIVRAECGDDAGILGAARLAFRQKGLNAF